MPVVTRPAGSREGPQQYKQSSRKGKKAWRKHIDVSDVEHGLELRSQDVIRRGGVGADQADKDIFAIDTLGDSAIPRRFPKHITKGLKADEIIAQRSAVPAVSLRKRPAEKTTDGIIPEKRQRTGIYVTYKEIQQLKRIADGKHESAVEVVDAAFDAWAPEEVAPDYEADGAFSFLAKDLEKKRPKTLARKPVSLAANGKAIPAVSKPVGGYSYNPLYTDWAERLEEEGRKAVDAESKRLEGERSKQSQKEAIARSAAEAEAAEARAELSEWDEDSAWSGIESGAESTGVRSKHPERKNKVQQNKAKRRKERERLARHEAAMKHRNDQLHRIKAVAKEIDEREKAMQLAHAETSDDSEEGDENEIRSRRFGKFAIPERDLELVLPGELQDSLRRLKPEGNLVKDRFRNLLIRGKVEARKRRPFKKQAKTKHTEKWTFKDFEVV
jgi:nucleolar protein 53